MKLLRFIGIALLVGVGLLVAALILTLITTGFIEGMLLLTGKLGLQHALGMDTQTTHNYASVSGVMPMMIAIMGFSGAFVTVYKHVNCEEPGCWRPGHRHPGHGRPVCRIHYHNDVIPPR